MKIAGGLCCRLGEMAAIRGDLACARRHCFGFFSNPRPPQIIPIEFDMSLTTGTWTRMLESGNNIDLPPNVRL